MCGIAGRVNLRSGAPVDPGIVAGMTDLLSHRGPDDAGVHCEGAVALGHRRLSVLDLSPLGRQPMWTADGRVGLTFNGEIYNFRALRADLERRGHAFRSQTDTEVILAAYREYGVDCVTHLAGMFAFALWDATERRLLLARDRVGKKPLFYREDADGIAFASEPTAFLADPSFTPEPDLQALSHYLSYQYVPAPTSAFRGVRVLPPAHVLVAQTSGCTLTRYWALRYAPPTRLTQAEAAEALTDEMRRAVRVRLVSDVPLGAFLSGGLDSGLTVAFMAEATDQPVRTFSIGFSEEAFDERQAARAVAQRYGTRHTEFVVRPRAIDLLPQLVWHYGQPFADPSALPTYLLSALTRRHVTVALTGDGGDEAFGGYTWHRMAMEYARADRIPRALRAGVAALVGAPSTGPGDGSLQARVQRTVARLAASRGQRHASWVMTVPDAFKASLCTPAFLDACPEPSSARLEAIYAASTAPDALHQALEADVLTYLPDDLLAKLDVASMAHGLEARCPWLDHDLLAFAATLPAACKIDGARQKVLLRMLAVERLPADVVILPKRGFTVPLSTWLGGDLEPFARDVLLDGRLAGRGYFRMDGVARLLDEHRHGRGAWHDQIWTLLMLELWHRTFIDQRPTAAPPAPAMPDADVTDTVAPA